MSGRKTAQVLTLCGALFAAAHGGSAVAADTTPSGAFETAALSPQGFDGGVSLPLILSNEDVIRYQKIFDLQGDGHWKAADKVIAGLGDRLLMGHVLAQRYLHPTRYRSRYKELKAWMAKYADHHYATQIYKLALKRRPKNWRRPKPPVRGYLGASTYDLSGAPDPADKPPRKRLNRQQRKKAAALMRRMRWHLRKGWTKSVKNLLATKEVHRLLSRFEMDEYRARLGFAYFVDGRDAWAVKWAGGAAARSGRYLPEAHWTTGLAAWRLGDYTLAARHFEAVATARGTSPWFVSAGAFWSARAYLLDHRPEAFNRLLGVASAYPRTFYGLLARRVLGLPVVFNWASPALERSAVAALTVLPAGRRGLALVQIGAGRRAERELKVLAGRADVELARGILALAGRANMPALGVRLEGLLYAGGGGYDSAAYPIPDWKPEGGFTVDRALIFALIRQESGFNPKAKSWAGASGLMQLMPRTASFVARDRGYRGAKRRRLFQPEINLTLGQKYIEILLADNRIDGDLFRLAAAWNGGPGNLNKWRRKINHLNDPLFFIESLPSRETRIFIERVLTNLWIYRNRLGQPSLSLDAIAAGEWPVYTALDQVPFGVASHEQNRR